MVVGTCGVWYAVAMANDMASGHLEAPSFLQSRSATCSSCGYNVHGLRTAVCPECHCQLTEASVLNGVRMRTRGVAIALVVCCVLAMVLVAATLNAWSDSMPQQWRGAVWPVVLLSVAGMLIWPSFVWIQKRQAFWRQVRVPRQMPWLSFAAWVLVAMGVSVAMWLPRTVLMAAWLVISVVQAPGRAWMGQLFSVERVYEASIATASTVCFIGLASAETRGALSVWMRRGLMVLVAMPCVAFVLFVWQTVKQGLNQ